VLDASAIVHAEFLGPDDGPGIICGGSWRIGGERSTLPGLSSRIAGLSSRIAGLSSRIAGLDLTTAGVFPRVAGGNSSRKVRNVDTLARNFDVAVLSHDNAVRVARKTARYVEVDVRDDDNPSANPLASIHPSSKTARYFEIAVGWGAFRSQDSRRKVVDLRNDAGNFTIKAG